MKPPTHAVTAMTVLAAILALVHPGDEVIVLEPCYDSYEPNIDLAGGTLDIWPLYLFHEHAQTVNAAISLRAHAEIIERTDGKLRLESDVNGQFTP